MTDDSTFDGDSLYLAMILLIGSMIHLITLNIQNGGYSNLNIVLWAMFQMQIDLGILTEVKIANYMYTRNCCDYTVFASCNKSKYEHSIAQFYQTENACWWVEGERSHGPNVILCVLAYGQCWWNMIGACISPSEVNGEMVNYIDETIWYHGTEDHYILLGDLNVKLDNPSDIHADDILSMVVLLALA
jgi:hypothetical protein